MKISETMIFVFITFPDCVGTSQFSDNSGEKKRDSFAHVIDHCRDRVPQVIGHGSVYLFVVRSWLFAVGENDILRIKRSTDLYFHFPRTNLHRAPAPHFMKSV